MIPDGSREVNKFDLKIVVLFDTEGSAPYKETVIRELTRLAVTQRDLPFPLEIAALACGGRRHSSRR
jgi:hypothetical protein